MVAGPDGTQQWRITDPDCQLVDLLTQYLSKDSRVSDVPLSVLLLGDSADRMILNDVVEIADKEGLSVEHSCNHEQHGSACIKLPQMHMVYKLLARMHSSSDSEDLSDSTAGTVKKAFKFFTSFGSITARMTRSRSRRRADDVSQAFELIRSLSGDAGPDIVIVSPPGWESSRITSEAERHLGEDDAAVAQWVEETSALLADVEALAPQDSLLVYHDYTASRVFESDRVEASVASHVQPVNAATREVAEERPRWKLLDLSLMLQATSSGHHHSAHDPHAPKSAVMLQAFNVCLNLFQQHSLSHEGKEVSSKEGPTAIAQSHGVQGSSSSPSHSSRSTPPTDYDTMDEYGKRAHRIWQHAAEDGLVLWTLANFSWLDFVLNWVASVRAAGIEHFFVGALDEELEREMQLRGIPCEGMNSSLGAADLAWGSDIFKERGREKIRFIRTMLQAGLSPMFSDLDVVWLRNPLPFVRQFGDANVLISSDTLIPAAKDGNQLDSCMQTIGDVFYGMGRMNVGIHVLRPSAIPLANAWLEKMSTTTEMEQMCWNLVLLEGLHDFQGVNDTEVYCKSLDDKVTIGLLPIALFQNGHTYFTQSLHKMVKSEPYAVHASFIGGRNNKRHHFQEGLMWQVDPPEHFKPPNGLITFDLDVPEELLRKSAPPFGLEGTVQKEHALHHAELAKHQLRQVRSAMAVAEVLGRGVVLPQLWCGMDNLWGPHTGRAWDTLEYTLPFACPLAHQIDVERAYHARDVEKSIPYFYESSLMQNPRMAEHVGGVVNVTACHRNASAADCCDGQEGTCARQPGGLSVSNRLNETGIRAAFPDAASAPILHFRNITDAWGGFVTAGMGNSLTQAFNGILRRWCCVEVEGKVTDLSLELEALGGP